MSELLKKSFGIAIATSLSRILGFIRVILVANFIGGGVYMAAWVLAFKIPNMFRRLLGEGALGAAIVPYITHSIEIDGKETAQKQMSVIMLALGMVLAAICAIIALTSISINLLSDSSEEINIALKILPILIPYAFFICLVGVSGSILNSLGVFFLPALGGLILNCAFIICYFIFGPLFKDSPMKLLYALSVCVFISGLLHLVLSLYLLKREGFLPHIFISIKKNSKILKDIIFLSLPGLIGAGALQISLVSDTAIAYFIGGEAIPALEYSERLVYLPIGVLAVSIGSVSLVNMSKSAANENYEELIYTMLTGIKHLCVLCIPIVFFICFFRYEIINALFGRGKFIEGNIVNETAYTLLFYSLGIPAFATMKIVVTAFYSRKDMKTPFKVSMFCIILNLILNLILMYPLRQGGVALATVITSFLNCFILFYILKKQFKFSLNSVFLTCMKISIVSFLASIMTSWIMQTYCLGLSKYLILVIISILFLIAMLVFGLCIMKNELLSNINFFKKYTAH